MKIEYTIQAGPDNTARALIYFDGELAGQGTACSKGDVSAVDRLRTLITNDFPIAVERTVQ